MKLASLLFSYCAIMFNIYAFVKVYGLISNKEVNFNYFDFLVSLILSVLAFFSNYYLEMPLKFLLSFSVILISFIYFFKDKLLMLLFKLFIVYLTVTLLDLLVSIVFLFFPVNSFIDIGNITILKGLSTILVSLLLLLVFTIPFILIVVNKLVNYFLSKRNFVFVFISFFAFISIISLAYLNASKFNLLIFITTMLLTLFFLFLCGIMIYQYFSNKHKEEEQKSLLNLMTEYERILDNDRMNRHEMLNNLVTLKTFKNKSSKDYEKLLDDIIKGYQLKKTEFYSKLYKLPSGIKGIIYYKIANIRDMNINVELLIAKDVKNIFENLNSRLYFRVCKILGIVMDNAFEASSESVEKQVLIDIYLEDKNIIFYIENSFSNNIDLSKIADKGKSSKGENRGYGLFIANKLVKEKDDIEFEQNINGCKFISILKIKNP